MYRSPVTSLRYAAHAVPDFDASLEFYRGVWGLQIVASEPGLAFLAAKGSDEPFVLRLRRAAVKHLDLISFAIADTATVDRLASEFASDGIRLNREPGALDSPGGGYGFRFFDLDGRLVELSADVTPRSARLLQPGEAIPQGLSHFVLNSPNVRATMKFYVDRLGFELSDWLGDFMCFLRVGSLHHIVAFSAAPHVSLNHVAFDMRGLDEYLRGTGRLIRAGVKPVWGPGRHGPGNNTFSYFVDPNGFISEYTSELQVVEDEKWQPQVWDTTAEKSDLWGTGGPFEEFLPHALNEPDRLIWTPSPV